MSGWELVQCRYSKAGHVPAGAVDAGAGPKESTSSSSAEEVSQDSLSSRLHRLQLLRHWLLHFCRVVHGHFTTCVILPFCLRVEELAGGCPSLDHFLAEHQRLVDDLCKQCLLGTCVSDSPVQLALKQVLSVVLEVRSVWRCGGCDTARLSALESSYAACHRFLTRLLGTLAANRTQHHQHLSGLIDALNSSCPVNV